jgi:transposase
MIPLTGTARIFLYREAADLRKSFDGLAGLVRTHLREDVFSGSLFVFVNRRRRLVKILYWDRDGFALWSKRLERGTFRVPQLGQGGRVELSPADLTMLLESITPLRVGRRYRRRVVTG